MYKVAQSLEHKNTLNLLPDCSKKAICQCPTISAVFVLGKLGSVKPGIHHPTGFLYGDILPQKYLKIEVENRKPVINIWT